MVINNKSKYIFLSLFTVIIISLNHSCNKNPSSPEIEGDYTEDYDFIWDTVNEYYPFLEFKKIDWDTINSIYSPQVKNVTKNNLRTIFVKLFGELKDGHANVYNDDGSPIQGYKIPRKEKDIDSFELSVVRKYFNKDLKQVKDLFKYEILPDNIGYIYYSKFSGVESDYEKFSDILNYLKNTKGLIFDIRHNGGGNNICTYYFIKRMISSPFEGVIWTKKGGGYYSAQTYYPEGDFQYTEPTVLLINGVCYSSADGFANLCKKIPHVTVVGDTTGGGGGVPEIFTLQKSKFKIRIPTRCEMRYDGEHVEWNGIPPDILVPQTKEDIDRNQDKQLEYAINYLNQLSN